MKIEARFQQVYFIRSVSLPGQIQPGSNNTELKESKEGFYILLFEKGKNVENNH